MTDTKRTEWPQQIEQIMESVDVECGLCQNEGADDIAGLLREVYAAMSYMKGRAEDLEVRTANAEAKLEEARRDAERYRWERQNPAWETEAFLSELTPEQYDAAIDEAMK